jgi:dihydroorotase
VRIINARNLNGDRFSFDVVSGVIKNLNSQKETLKSPNTIALTAFSLLQNAKSDSIVLDAEGELIIPAALDMHVHSRSPGLTAKEDWHTLAKGAWRGGVVAVADMPNTIPPTMTRAAVLEKAKIAAESGLEFTLQLGVGSGNINQVAGLLTDPDLPLAALKVFYGRSTGDLMYDDLNTLGKSLPVDCKKLIVFHSEDQCGVDVNHAKFHARTHLTANRDFEVHSLIRDSATAHASTKIILEWAEAYKRPVHIAHVSTPLEVEMVQAYKAKGLPITCEVAPHHVLFSTDDYARLGPLVKMNPPLRSRAEKDALLKLVGQGAVDIFATDHAPHLLSEKHQEVAKSPSGVPAVELFYPLVFKIAEMTGLSSQKILEMSASRPAELFGFHTKGQLADGFDGDFVWIRRENFLVRNEEVVSKCGWTPYDGFNLPVKVMGTWNRGKCVFLSK